jgi:hypothetical protein
MANAFLGSMWTHSKLDTMLQLRDMWLQAEPFLRRRALHQSRKQGYLITDKDKSFYVVLRLAAWDVVAENGWPVDAVEDAVQLTLGSLRDANTRDLGIQIPSRHPMLDAVCHLVRPSIVGNYGARKFKNSNFDLTLFSAERALFVAYPITCLRLFRFIDDRNRKSSDEHSNARFDQTLAQIEFTISCES